MVAGEPNRIRNSDERKIKSQNRMVGRERLGFAADTRRTFIVCKLWFLNEMWLGVRDDFRNWLQLGLAARERT